MANTPKTADQLREELLAALNRSPGFNGTQFTASDISFAPASPTSSGAGATTQGAGTTGTGTGGTGLGGGTGGTGGGMQNLMYPGMQAGQMYQSHTMGKQQEVQAKAAEKARQEEITRATEWRKQDNAFRERELAARQQHPQQLEYNSYKVDPVTGQRIAVDSATANQSQGFTSSGNYSADRTKINNYYDAKLTELQTNLKGTTNYSTQQVLKDQISQLGTARGQALQNLVQGYSPTMEPLKLDSYTDPYTGMKLDPLTPQPNLNVADPFKDPKFIQELEKAQGDLIVREDADWDAGLKKFANGQNMKFGLGAATAAGSGFGLWESVGSMFENGKASTGGVAGAAGSFLGLYLGLKAMSSAWTNVLAAGKAASMLGKVATFAKGLPFIGKGITFLMANPLIAAAAIAAILIVIAFFKRKPSQQEQDLIDASNMTVWTTNTVLALTAATGMTLMGFNLDQIAALGSQGLPISTSYLRSQLSNKLVNADGSPYFDENSSGGALPYKDANGNSIPIVIKGANGKGDKVMLLSTLDGNRDTVQVYDLGNNMAFSAPTRPDGAYINFFGANGKVNPKAVKAVTNQRSLAEAAPSLDPKSAKNAVTCAGSMTKDGECVAY